MFCLFGPQGVKSGGYGGRARRHVEKPGRFLKDTVLRQFWEKNSRSACLRVGQGTQNHVLTHLFSGLLAAWLRELGDCRCVSLVMMGQRTLDY